MNNQAVLSSSGGFTVFRFRDHVIRFKAPYSLERYTKVKQWDHGYLVVEAKYAHNPGGEEEYIDLKPILNDLYIEPEEFLSQIEGVRIAHE